MAARAFGSHRACDQMAAASRAGGGPRQAWRCGTEGPPPVAPRNVDRAVAFSRQLVLTHDELRRQLDLLRGNLGRGRIDRSLLLTHCLSFCAALTSHHQGEDAGMFAELLRERPDLADTIANLINDRPRQVLKWASSNDLYQAHITTSNQPAILSESQVVH